MPAQLLARQHEQTKAIAVFEECRTAEPLLMDGMDVYAEALHSSGNAHALNRLAHDLIDIEQLRPEPWVAVALHTLMGGDAEQALVFAKKAASIAPQSVPVLRTQGMVETTLLNHEAAKGLYVRALAVSKDLSVYEGLVQAYLELGKPKEALMMAREAAQLVPRSAEATTLIGQVYAVQAHTQPDRQADYTEKAKRSFLKALSLDRLAVGTVLALAKLYEFTSANDEAIKL